MSQRTTAEELDYIRKIVSWTLWKVATDVVEMRSQTRADVEELFKDKSRVANIVGEFAANIVNKSAHTMDYRAFLEEFDE